MSEVSDVEIGKLIEKVDQLSVDVRENNIRIDCLEKQLTRTKGFGVGLAVGLIGVSSATASFITKRMGQYYFWLLKHLGLSGGLRHYRQKWTDWLESRAEQYQRWKPRPSNVALRYITLRNSLQTRPRSKKPLKD